MDPELSLPIEFRQSLSKTVLCMLQNDLAIRPFFLRGSQFGIGLGKMCPGG